MKINKKKLISVILIILILIILVVGLIIRLNDKKKEEMNKPFEFDENKKFVLMTDVSRFNATHNFKEKADYQKFVKDNDIKYVYIRLGGRGYGEAGNMYTDKNVDMFIEATEELNIPYGFYFLDEALNDKEIEEEMNYVNVTLNYLKNSKELNLKNNVLPLAIDIEYQEGKGRTDDLGENRAELLKKLVLKFKEKGIDTILYINAKRAGLYTDGVDAKVWVANYNIKESGKIPSFKEIYENEFIKYDEELKKKIIGWQFSETGASQHGIEDKVDLSLVDEEFFQDYISGNKDKRNHKKNKSKKKDKLKH